MRTEARIGIAALCLSAACLVGIGVKEGYRENAYIPAKGDKPTIGFGETAGVKMGDTTDPVRALVQLQKSANEHANGIKKCIKVPLHQHEFDAYTSLAYNIGVTAFCSSTLVKKLNASDYDGACLEILKWNKFKGRELPGLTRRRMEEYRLCRGSSE